MSVTKLTVFQHAHDDVWDDGVPETRVASPEAISSPSSLAAPVHVGLQLALPDAVGIDIPAIFATLPSLDVVSMPRRRKCLVVLTYCYVVYT